MPVLAAAVGLLIGGIIGGLGGGGGVLAVPALVYLLGQAPSDATTGSLIIVGAAAVVGGIARARSGEVAWRTAAGFGLAGIPAAAVGAVANRTVAEPVLLLSFSLLTIAAAAAMVLDSRRTAASAGSGAPAPTGGRAPARTAAKVVPWAAAVGFLTGFLGIGGGFLVVPVLVIALRMPVRRAIGTSLVIIALNAVSSLAARAGNLDMDWSVIAPFALAAIAGTLAGKAVSDRLSGELLARAFAVVIGTVGVVVGIHATISLAG
jgi:uncharacterized membrane protein YfcA